MTDKFYDNRIMSFARKGGATVCGIGISNLPLIDFLLERDIDITVRDRKTRDKIGEDIIKPLEKRGVKLILGDNYLEGIDEKVIFRTPGLRPDNPFLVRALEKGSVLTSEMELFFELTPAHIIGITGSDGKTTTTTLTYKFIEAELRECGKGKAYVGGNIGEPLLPKVAQMTKDDYAIVELSSFQLMTMRRSPERSAVTNLSPNHLDWHTGMDEYAGAKTNIFAHEVARQLTVNAESVPTMKMGKEAENVDVVFFSSKKRAYGDIVPKDKKNCRAVFERDGMIIVSDGETEDTVLKTEDILLPGRHNVENYMTAIANTYGIVNKKIYTVIAKTFPGVEHRLELVREFEGVKYYNSSIDSSPTRTAAALSALKVKPVVICGGYDKKIPFAPLATALCSRAEAVVLTGATAGKIYDALKACDLFDPDKLEVRLIDDFDGAVMEARKMAHKGGAVLLSPACASFDKFSNFAERGRHFKDIVRSF